MTSDWASDAITGAETLLAIEEWGRRASGWLWAGSMTDRREVSPSCARRRCERAKKTTGQEDSQEPVAMMRRCAVSWNSSLIVPGVAPGIVGFRTARIA